MALSHKPVQCQSTSCHKGKNVRNPSCTMYVSMTSIGAVLRRLKICAGTQELNFTVNNTIIIALQDYFTQLKKKF